MQKAQQLNLQMWTHFTNFIQKYSATIGLLKNPFMTLLMVKRSRRMTKQFGFGHIIRHRSATQNQKGCRRTIRTVMARLSEHLFTCAGFPFNQQRLIKHGQFFRLAHQAFVSIRNTHKMFKA
ncbi:Uncharacterised protein [Vibrio cholerae]|nr:Uncharacterised protein [Vibrio cholerae]